MRMATHHKICAPFRLPQISIGSAKAPTIFLGNLIVTEAFLGGTVVIGVTRITGLNAGFDKSLGDFRAMGRSGIARKFSRFNFRENS